MRRWYHIFFLILTVLALGGSLFFAVSSGLQLYRYLEKAGAESGLDAMHPVVFLSALVLVPVLVTVLLHLLAADRVRNLAESAGLDEGIKELDGVALEELTVQDPDLREIFDSFRSLRTSLDRNLSVVDAFRQRIEEEYEAKDRTLETQQADTEALVQEANATRQEAGKFEITRQILKAMAGASSSGELLGYIIEMSARLTHSARASIMLVDKSGENLFLHKTLGWQPDKETSARRVPLGEGFAGHVAKERKRMLVTDIETEIGRGNKPEYASKSFVILPILAGKNVVGVLNLTDKPGGAIYDLDDLELLNLLLLQASLALENVFLRGSRPAQ